MERFDMRSPSAFRMTAEAPAERVTAFLQKVYGWMFIGLAVTAVVAFMVAGSPTLLTHLLQSISVYRFDPGGTRAGLLPLGQGRDTGAHHGDDAVHRLLRLEWRDAVVHPARLYWRVDCVDLSGDLWRSLRWPLRLDTKRSLAGVGQFLFMGLIGLVLASIVGMFWHNDTLQFLISTIGVIVFTGLTAWDAQRLKQMAATVPEERMGSYAVVGALALYLNFINLFLMLLRLLGGRRD